MKQRGRKSALSLTLSPRLKALQRPDAPYDLTDEERDEWVTIVNRVAPDWFPRETRSLLTQLCRHVVNAPRLAQLVTATLAKRKLNVSAYNTPLKMQERESRCIASLSTKLRITQQATVSPKTKKPSVINVPWQDSPFWCWRALAG